MLSESHLGRTRRPLVDIGGPLLLWMYLVVNFQPFEQLAPVPVAAVTVLFPALGVVILVFTPSERLSRAPVSLALLGVLVWYALSLFWSENPVFTLFLIRYQVVPLFILGLVVASMPPRLVVRTLLGIVLVLGAWSFLSSIALPASKTVVVEDGVQQTGFRGTFGHKNHLGIFMVCGLCLLMPFYRGRYRAVVLGLFLATIVLTRSATAAGGLLAVSFVWFWTVAIRSQRTPRQRQALLVMSVSSAVAGVLILLGLLPTLLGLYDKDLTFTGRTEIWAASAETIGDRPIQGYGFGGVWTDDTEPLTVDLHRRIGFQAAHAHNSAMATLLEVGVVGLGLMVAVVVQTIRNASWCLRRPKTFRYGEWGLLTMIALLFMGIAEPLFERAHLGLIVIVWAVLARARIDEQARERAERRSTAALTTS